MTKPFRQKKAKGEEGNTDPLLQSIRHTFYCGTVFDYENIIDAIENRLNEICKKWIYGLEICPTTNRKHLQLFFSLKKAMRITELKIPGQPHLDDCKGTEEQNIIYCKKDGNYKSYGFPKPIKIIENLHQWQKDIEEIFYQEPDDRTINWFWEDVGGIGKSAFVKYMVIKHKCLFCDGGKKSDIINLVFNNNMDDCKCIIWDIPRSTKGHISYSTLESIKNGLICNTKYETGVKYFNSPHVFVFANFPPDDENQLSLDRWNIVNLASATMTK